MTTNNPKSYNVKPKDYTVLQVMLAIVCFVVSLFFLRLAEALPLTVRSLQTLSRATLTGLIAYGAVAAASIVLLIVKINRAVFRISKHTLAVAIIGLITCFVLRRYFTDRMPFLYFLHAAFYGLYIIFMLYGTEFFMVSLMTSVAGWSFHSLCGGLSFTLRPILYVLIVVLVCVACVVISWIASGKKGSLSVFGKKWRLFPPRFQPTGIILTAAIWLLCLIAGFLFGSMFLYYSMFAAVAYELIAAVYYTFQLK